MKTFITEVIIDGDTYEGPRINALTRQDADDIASKITW
jgi:hypothetical protein